jgi:hypothetical protein
VLSLAWLKQILMLNMLFSDTTYQDSYQLPAKKNSSDFVRRASNILCFLIQAGSDLSVRFTTDGVGTLLSACIFDHTNFSRLSRLQRAISLSLS